MDIYNSLQMKLCNVVCNDNSHIKSSALVITENGDKIYGVDINLIFTSISSLSNAICNAVSEGYKKFKKIYVFIDSEDPYTLILDDMSKGLLKEFNICEIHLFTNNKDIHIQKI